MNAVGIAELPGLAADLNAPFELILPAATGVTRWSCREVLRVLPGRRLVVRAGVADGTATPDVVLKLFYGRGHRRYCARERQGLARLEAAGLPVPKRLGQLAGTGLSGLVLEYLPDATAVQDSDRTALETLATCFGRLHAAGGRQTDQHLENFVVSGGVLYALDGDGVRAAKPIRRRRGELDNLAMLVAQCAPGRDDGFGPLLSAYERGRGTPAPSPEEFERHLRRARRRRLRRYLAKTRRNCTEFAVVRRPHRVTYAVRGTGEAVLTRLFAAPLDSSATRFLPGEVLKAGNSATVVRTGAGEPVIVKRFNVKNASHGLRRMLRRHPRYRRAWMFGQLLTLLDIPTPRPLALVEERGLLWRGTAYLVQANLSGPDLAAEVAATGLSESRCAEVVALFRMLRAAGLSHGDTKASNFIVHEGRLHLIDLDAMRLTGRGFDSDLQRFLDNWHGADRRSFEAAFAHAGLL